VVGVPVYVYGDSNTVEVGGDRRIVCILQSGNYTEKYRGEGVYIVVVPRGDNQGCGVSGGSNTVEVGESKRLRLFDFRSLRGV
jgi:hypothetical protein